MDIDLDMPPSWDRTMFPWTRASVERDGELTKHPVGLYPQNISIDPLTNLAAIPYEQAEELGYLKLDFLSLHVYSAFSSRVEIEEFLRKEPDWTLLLVPSNHEKLFQLANHGELLLRLRPTSILELADIMALIRPGKKQLVGLYEKDRNLARQALWSTGESGYTFKKSHALGYAFVLLLQLHLIEQGRL